MYVHYESQARSTSNQQDKTKQNEYNQAADVKGGLDTDCFVFAVRNDKAKFKRMKEIIGINSHIINSTRMRFSDVETTVFQPTFPAPPRKIAVASIPLLSSSEPADSLPGQ